LTSITIQLSYPFKETQTPNNPQTPQTNGLSQIGPVCVVCKGWGYFFAKRSRHGQLSLAYNDLAIGNDRGCTIGAGPKKLSHFRQPYSIDGGQGKFFFVSLQKRWGTI